MVNQVRDLDVNEPYFLEVGGKKFKITCREEAIRLLRIRDKLKKTRDKYSRKGKKIHQKRSDIKEREGK